MQITINDQSDSFTMNDSNVTYNMQDDVISEIKCESALHSLVTICEQMVQDHESDFEDEDNDDGRTAKVLSLFAEMQALFKA